jgi:hypothetical protein
MPRGKNKQVRVGDYYLINDVSRLVNLSQKRIREYEKGGLYQAHPGEKHQQPAVFRRLMSSQIQQINHLIHDRGFTLACLRNLMVLAPCWNIFDCPDKEKCPAFQLPWRPCYEVRQYKETLCNGPCERCAVYLNRDVKKEKILEKVPVAE